jgi:UDP-N-acetylmuramoyl-L-alanyl-D-glutamate--2,6-diaminopimelate ligase
MKLDQLIHNIPVKKAIGSTNIEVNQICFDSRKVQSGDVFVAVRGAAVDGHRFIETALLNGAKAIVCEAIPAETQSEVCYVEVANSAAALGLMASEFYGHPSAEIKLVGVTGTNGKTTTATLLWQLFTRLGYKCGLLGTVENRVGEKVLSSTHTTPDAVQIQGLFREMADAGCTYAFMEVSSHAVHQQRIAGIQFAGGVFTNLTHDHLDYHKTFNEYRDVKKLFFDLLPKKAFALTNIDDRNGAVMLQNTAAQKSSYGLKKPADFKSKIIENALNGLHLEMDGVAIHARMIGEFNAYNLTAAYAVAMLMDCDKMETLTILSDLQGAEGRFDYVTHPAKAGCIGIVDYAHTPDALEKVLETIAKLKKNNSKVITVTGAGGDRDKTKRPIMAQVCARMSDQLILTTDNPRTEDPAAILKDMEAGLDAEGNKKTLVIADREQAIKTAVKLAGPTDVILVAGKGHEKYQDIQGVKHPFDDKEILIKTMEQNG